jgi:hypothetical protein
MAQTSYPFDSANTTEAQYSQLFRRLNFTGVSGYPGDTAVKVTANSSGMTVSVAAGYAMVRGHFYKNDTAQSLTIGTSSSNPRKDLIVLKLDPTTANSIVLAVKAGTAGASPSDPSLTQSDEDVYEFPIARVNVPGSATTISAGNVDDLRQYMGAPVGRWTTALRPTSPDTGLIGYNTTTNVAELWNGTAWTPVSPSSVLASILSDAEQAKLAAGKIRSGADSAATAFRVYVQSGTPTGASSGDLWFW